MAESSSAADAPPTSAALQSSEALHCGAVAAAMVSALAQRDAVGARQWLAALASECGRAAERHGASAGAPRSACAEQRHRALIFVASAALAHADAPVRRSAARALAALCRAPSPHRSTHALWALPALLGAVQRENGNEAASARTQHTLLAAIPSLAHSTQHSGTLGGASIGSVALDGR